MTQAVRRPAGLAKPMKRATAAKAAAPKAKTRAWWLEPSTLALAGLILIVAIYRVVRFQVAPGPPGSDPANWLAFSRELFGEKVKSAASMYFPVSLLLLKVLRGLFSDLVALKALAVLASVAPAAPFFLLLRKACSTVVSAGLTLALLMAGYQVEALAWGAYPQLLATAFLIACLLFLDEGMTAGKDRPLLFSAVAAALVAGTHHFTVLVLVPSVAIYLGFAAVRQRADLKTLARRVAKWAGLTLLFSLAFLPWYVQYLRLVDGNGALNAQSWNDLSDVLSFVFSEAPLTWIALIVFGTLGAAIPWGGPGAARLRPIALALVLAPAAVYGATREMRAFEIMEVGALLSVGAVLAGIDYELGRASLRPSILRLGRAAAGLGLAGLLLILVPNGNLRFENAIERYTAIDEPAKEALVWLRDQTPPGSVVLANGTRWTNFSWWIEGFAQRPSYGVLLPQYLAFREEKEQAVTALRLVQPETTAEEARTILRETGISYIFMYKDKGGLFQDLVAKVPVYRSFENSEFLILRFAPDAAKSGP